MPIQMFAYPGEFAGGVDEPNNSRLPTRTLIDNYSTLKHYSQVANTYINALVQAPLAIGGSIVLAAGAVTQFVLNYVAISCSIAGVFNITNGAKVLVYGVTVSASQAVYNFMPIGLYCPNIGQDVTFNNLSGVAMNVYITVTGCQL